MHVIQGNFREAELHHCDCGSALGHVLLNGTFICAACVAASVPNYDSGSNEPEEPPANHVSASR